MCEEKAYGGDAPSGGFRQTADEALEKKQALHEIAAQKEHMERQSGANHPHDPCRVSLEEANAGFKRRVVSLENQIIQMSNTNDSLFETFAKLARNNIVDDIFVAVFEPAPLRPGGARPIQTEYGPYTLRELLQKYNEIRGFKNFVIKHRGVHMAEQRTAYLRGQFD